MRRSRITLIYNIEMKSIGISTSGAVWCALHRNLFADSTTQHGNTMSRAEDARVPFIDINNFGFTRIVAAYSAALHSFHFQRSSARAQRIRL